MRGSAGAALGGGRGLVWRALVPVVAGVAGLVLATSAVTARGTDLRGSRDRVSDLIAREEQVVNRLATEERALRTEIAARSRALAAALAPAAGVRRRADALAPPAGLTSVAGPGLTVTLDDAPRPAGRRPIASDPSPDDLVVHQQDVLGVVNALWAGGAEAMTIMGKRVVSTSAVRCVGNTLLLQGAVYSPPFTIAAIGDPSRLTAALDADPAVSIFRQYVAAYGLGYRVAPFTSRTLPAYDGPLDGITR